MSGSSIKMASMGSHNSRILDQFTRQAAPFAAAPAIRNQEALDRIVQWAGAGPDDNVLDVACGPGLLACAFAKVAKRATGIDMTPAMLEQAHKTQQEQGIKNVRWQQGDVYSLPFPPAQFSIVSSRFVFHHLQEPLAALMEMKRVCKPGGKVVIADMAPQPAKAAALNAAELLRDPSHVRALPLEELHGLFEHAGLGAPQIFRYRMEGELEDLLSRSFPNEGDADKLRKIFADSLADDALDLNTRQENGKIYYSFPVAVLVAQRSN
ncbi:MAG TPA: methyltransferase domain-containing protein [Candidatus Binatia bacterium]|nr:methyltransferase domain-containing protein [Candidatus Binatia bacterium]